MTLLAVMAGCATLSPMEEQELGDEAAAEISKELDFLRDRWVINYIDDIGREILEAAGPQPFEYRFHVVEDEALNAFALPAGYIYINTGVIMAADNVSELAGVMAHEVGHAALHHVAKNYHRQRNTGILVQLVSAALSIFVGGAGASGGQMLGQLGAVAYVNSFTREAEEEADTFAVGALPRAGYDPTGLVTFFAKLQGVGGPHIPAFLSSHPATADRMSHTSDLIRAADLPPGLKITDNGQLEIIQRRIELLQGRP